MTTEFVAYFNDIVDSLVSSGISAAEAEKMVNGLLEEFQGCLNAADSIHEPETVSLSDWEYELSRGIVDGLAAGGMKSNRAMLLVAMHAVAVEERLLGNMS